MRVFSSAVQTAIDSNNLKFFYLIKLEFSSTYHFCSYHRDITYDGDIYLTIALNGFIHTVMYTYYFICMHTKDKKTGKSLPIWWKSSLTLLQLFQFITMMSQGLYLIIFGCESLSIRVTATYVVYILSLFFLFAQFFVASYMQPKKSKTA